MLLNTEVIHDHTFNSANGEALLESFEQCIGDKVFLAAYRLEKMIREIVPPAGYKGWRKNCFDTYSIEEQFIQNGESLELRNDADLYDFKIGKKALSDLSEVSDPGSWDPFLEMVYKADQKADVNSYSSLLERRLNIFNNVIQPFNLARSAYFAFEAFDQDKFLKLGITGAIEYYKNIQDVVLIRLDVAQKFELENINLNTVIILDEYEDLK